MAVYTGMLLFTDNTSISMSTVASCSLQQSELCEWTGKRAAAFPGGSGGQYHTDVSEFEQPAIPVVPGLLCRAHNKVAALLKSLHLYRKDPILHLSIVYAIPKTNVIYLSSVCPVVSVVLHKYKIHKNVWLFPASYLVPLHFTTRKRDLNTGFIGSSSSLIKKY